jgi:hypothetical protein
MVSESNTLPNLKHSVKYSSKSVHAPNQLMLQVACRKASCSTRHIKQAKRKTSFSPALVVNLSLTPPLAQNEKEHLSTTAALDIARTGSVFSKDLPVLHQPTNNTQEKNNSQNNTQHSTILERVLSSRSETGQQ